ncbi:MAG: hypothetical protein ABFC77_04180 [Thermoguttaceae bacterium]
MNVALRLCFVWAMTLSGIGVAAVPEIPKQTGPEVSKNTAPTRPMTLDLSQFYYPRKGPAAFQEIAKNREFDGVPFQIGGQIKMWGKTPVSRGAPYPDTVCGIRVGRTFDDLYLVHHTGWPDVEGETVAYLCFNYGDGTKQIVPIRYGYQVRDWYNLPSYEKETMADPNTTICLRLPPMQFKAPIRVFKSRIANPLPKKIVETLDIVSSRHLASYVLLAATVTDRSQETTMAPVGDRQFDGKLTVRVVDDATGHPIEGAVVTPGMSVLNEGVVGSPFYTSAAGEGVIPYPTRHTTVLFASVEKEGYQRSGNSWRVPAPDVVTIRLRPNP